MRTRETLSPLSQLTFPLLLPAKIRFRRSIRTKFFVSGKIQFISRNLPWIFHLSLIIFFIVLRPQKRSKMRNCYAHKMQRIRRTHAHKKSFCSMKKGEKFNLNIQQKFRGGARGDKRLCTLEKIHQLQHWKFNQFSFLNFPLSASSKYSFSFFFLSSTYSEVLLCTKKLHACL